MTRRRDPDWPGIRWGAVLVLAAIVALAAVAAGLLAGCGSQADPGPPASTPASACAYQAASLGGTITVQASGTDCGQLLQALASFGETWTATADPAAPDQWGTQPSTACSLASGGATLVVRVAGGDQLDASTICSAYEQSGWQPHD